MIRHLIVIGSLFCAGCVSMGSNYDPAAVSQLEEGMPKAEVIKLLGQPNTTTTMADGQVALGWVHSTGSMFGASARSVSLLFDANGRLLKTFQNQTEVK